MKSAFCKQLWNQDKERKKDLQECKFKQSPSPSLTLTDFSGVQSFPRVVKPEFAPPKGKGTGLSSSYTSYWLISGEHDLLGTPSSLVVLVVVTLVVCRWFSEIKLHLSANRSKEHTGLEMDTQKQSFRHNTNSVHHREGGK